MVDLTGERHLPVLHATKRDRAADRGGGTRGYVDDPGNCIEWTQERVGFRPAPVTPRDTVLVKAVGRINRNADGTTLLLMASGAVPLLDTHLECRIPRQPVIDSQVFR